jgi:hypothetical protein
VVATMLGRDKVPADLLPHQIRRAYSVVTAAEL